MYIVSSDGPITVGTTDIAFAEIGGSSGAGGGSVDGSTITNGSITPNKLQNGTQGYPLVAGAGSPEYALLTGTGLAGEIYKSGLIIGSVDEDVYLTFGTDTITMSVDNEVKLSANATGGAFVGTWSGSSDEKWKDLLGPISADPLADLDKVDSQTWTWKPGYHFGDAGAFGAGVVAQQFQLVCPSAVTFSAEQDGLVVDYNAVHSFNLACIKALKAENASRQAENAALEARVASLEQDNTDLKARLAALEAAFHAHTHP
jgi:hypothetical protein